MTVIAVNASLALDEEFVDARIAGDPLRLASDASFHEASSCRLIAPAELLTEKTRTLLMAEGRVLDMGLKIDDAPNGRTGPDWTFSAPRLALRVARRAFSGCPGSHARRI